MTRARDLAHSRPHRDPNRHVTQSAFDVFMERLHIAIRSLEDIVDAAGRAVVVRGDARVLPLSNNSVQLIVTSPPYAANAIDYMRAHKFSLMWLGYPPKTLTDLRGKYIGAELRSSDLIFASETANRVLQSLQQKDECRAAVVAHYFRDMEASLREMLNVLTEGRAAVLIAGSSTGSFRRKRLLALLVPTTPGAVRRRQVNTGTSLVSARVPLPTRWSLTVMCSRLAGMSVPRRSRMMTSCSRKR